MPDERRKNNEDVKLLLQEIKHKYDTTDKKLDNILEYNARQDKNINEIHKVVHGNGEPEKGLLIQHHKMKEKVKQTSSLNEKMAERIASLEKWRWYIGGGIALLALVIVPLAYIILR